MTDSSDIDNRIRRAAERWPVVNPQELEHLVRLISKLPPNERLTPLLSVFIDPPANAYTAQEYAGQLLARLKPACPYAADELLSKVLPRWNLSVERLPLYLREVFGHEALLGSLERLAEEGVDLQVLRTVRYWLRAQRKL